MFDPALLYALRPPGQLSQADVVEIAGVVTATFGRAMPLAIAEALTRLLDSHRTPDARAVAEACQAAGAIGCAAALDQILLGAARE